jgi:hypothetical protein
VDPLQLDLAVGLVVAGQRPGSPSEKKRRHSMNVVSAAGIIYALPWFGSVRLCSFRHSIGILFQPLVLSALFRP